MKAEKDNVNHICSQLWKQPLSSSERVGAVPHHLPRIKLSTCLNADQPRSIATGSTNAIVSLSSSGVIFTCFLRYCCFITRSPEPTKLRTEFHVVTWEEPGVAIHNTFIPAIRVLLEDIYEGPLLKCKLVVPGSFVVEDGDDCEGGRNGRKNYVD